MKEDIEVISLNVGEYDDTGSPGRNSGHRKFLVFNTSFFDISQTFIYQQVKALETLGEVHLLSSRFLNPHGFPVDSYKKHIIRRHTGLIGKLLEKIQKRSCFNLSTVFTLNNLLRKERFDAIHAHFGTNALCILPYAKLYSIPLIVSFHGADASRMLRQPQYARRLPALFDYASAIIISSRHMEETLELQPWHEKVHLVVYGVDTNIPGNSGNGSDSGKLKILHSGRITAKKGVPDLIRVFSDLAGRHDNIELHIAGDGEEIQACMDLVQKNNLTGKVIFYGAVSHDKVFELFRETDIFVLNSRTAEDGDMEGTPVTMLEAMAMGKAVVSTRHAGIPGVIEHGYNGLLAAERSNEQLRDSIERYVLDTNFRKTTGLNARETIRDRYSIEILQNRLHEVYAKLDHVKV